ncbi:MAG: hypothetical protein RI957_74 [Verrucomicrobiota bacterium]
MRLTLPGFGIKAKLGIAVSGCGEGLTLPGFGIKAKLGIAVSGCGEGLTLPGFGIKAKPFRHPTAGQDV